MAPHPQKTERSGPEMNPEERRLLAWPREILKGQYVASSDARHGNGARGVGRLFKWLAAGRSLERKLIRKVVKGFHNGEWGVRNDRLLRFLNRLFK